MLYDDVYMMMFTEITQEKKNRAKKKDRDVYIKNLEEASQNDGLSRQEIERLVDVAACGKLRKSVKKIDFIFTSSCSWPLRPRGILLSPLHPSVCLSASCG